MQKFIFDDLSLLQLAAIAEEFAWGAIDLTAAEREALRKQLVNRFEQVEALNQSRYCPHPPNLAGNS